MLESDFTDAEGRSEPTCSRDDQALGPSDRADAPRNAYAGGRCHGVKLKSLAAASAMSLGKPFDNSLVQQHFLKQ